MSLEPQNPAEHGQKQPDAKYILDIEGKDYEWASDIITAEDIIRLAGWPAGTEVIEVNEKDQSEVTLAAGQSIPVKPGHGFGKKVKFKRG